MMQEFPINGKSGYKPAHWNQS